MDSELELPAMDSNPTELPDVPEADAEEVTEAPKRRRRKRGPNKSQKGQDIPPAVDPDRARLDLIAALDVSFGMAFDMVATARGAHWALTTDDRQAMAQTWGTALAPYFAAVAKGLPFVLALATTAGVIIPRAQLDAKRAKATKLSNATPAEVAPTPAPVVAEGGITSDAAETVTGPVMGVPSIDPPATVPLRRRRTNAGA